MVLVPNAPLVPESKASVQRVLRTTSGNTHSNIENGFGPSKPIQQPHQYVELQHPRNSQESQSSQSKAQKEEIEQREKWQRLSRAITGQQRKSARYVAYRTRQRKEKGKDGKEVWSVEMDDAFMRAIRTVRPIGKKKMMMMQNDGHQKQCGTNELIAAEMFRITGEMRTRKQISSHIQVLNNLMKNLENQPIIDDPRPPESEDFNDIKYEWNFPHPFSGNNPFEVGFQPKTYSPGSSTTSLQTQIQSIQFHMCVYPPEGLEAMHLYTTMQSEMGAQTRPIEQEPEWHFKYPGLARIHQSRHPLTSEIILLETNLALMEELPAKGSSLSIHLFANLAGKQTNSNWRSRTTFYEAAEAKDECLKTLNVAHDEHSERTQLEIPLESTWWVRLFHQITARRHELRANWNAKLRENPHLQCYCDACKSLNESAQFALHKEEENTRRYLREMTITQELFSEFSSHPQTILLWRFRQARPHEAATTTWRHLVPPANQTSSDFVTTTLPLEACSNAYTDPLLLDSQPSSQFHGQYDLPTHISQNDVPSHQLSQIAYDHPFHPDTPLELHNQNQPREQWEAFAQIHPDLFSKPVHLSPTQRYSSPTHTLPSFKSRPAETLYPYPQPFLPSQPASHATPEHASENFQSQTQSHSQESFSTQDNIESFETDPGHGVFDSQVEMTDFGAESQGLTDPTLEDFTGGHIDLSYDVNIPSDDIMASNVGVDPTHHVNISNQHDNMSLDQDIIAPTAQMGFGSVQNLEKELLRLERNCDRRLAREGSNFVDSNLRAQQMENLQTDEHAQNSQPPAQIIHLQESDEQQSQLEQEVQAIQEMSDGQLVFEPHWGVFPQGLFADVGFEVGELEEMRDLGRAADVQEEGKEASAEELVMGGVSGAARELVVGAGAEGALG